MNYKTIVILILSIVLLFSCCNKKEEKDFRGKYVGKWSFRSEINEINTDSIGYYRHDTVNYIGKIAYGNSNDELKIQYTGENSITLTVNETGELSNFPTP